MMRTQISGCNADCSSCVTNATTTYTVMPIGIRADGTCHMEGMGSTASGPWQEVSYSISAPSGNASQFYEESWFSPDCAAQTTAAPANTKGHPKTLQTWKIGVIAAAGFLAVFSIVFIILKIRRSRERSGYGYLQDEPSW